MSQQIRIGIGVEPTDAFWVQIVETIYQRSQKSLAELVPIYASSLLLEANFEEQNALLEDIISQELDVCLGWHLPEAMAHQVLDTGLPIVHLSETHIEHPLSVSPIGLRNVAEELAQYLADAIHYEGEVVAIGGLLQEGLPDDGRSRIAGLRAVFSRYPQIHFQHIPTHWEEDRALPELHKALSQRQSPVAGLIGLSDLLALTARDLLLEFSLCNKKIPVVGINGDPLALAAIIEGRMRATIETSATHLANQAFDIALNIVYGQPYPAHYPYNPRLITSENVANVAAEKLVTIANIPNRLIGSDHQWLAEYQNYLETSLDISRQIGSVLNSERLPIELATLT